MSMGYACPKCWDKPGDNPTCSCGYLWSKQFYEDRRYEDTKYHPQLYDKVSKPEAANTTTADSIEPSQFVALLCKELPLCTDLDEFVRKSVGKE